MERICTYEKEKKAENVISNDAKICDLSPAAMTLLVQVNLFWQLYASLKRQDFLL